MAKMHVQLAGEDKDFLKRLNEYFLIHYNNSLTTGDGGLTVSVGEADCDVYMYQKASSIYSGIASLYLRSLKPSDNMETDKKAVLQGVLSRGCLNKASAVEKLCTDLSSDGYKVLYICPETYQTLESPFTESEEKDFSQLYYYIHNKEENLNEIIETLASYDILRKVYYLKNIYITPDIFITKEDMNFLLASLEKNRLYDYIIFDIPSYISEAYLELMRWCNKIILISDQRDRKFEDFLHDNGIENVESDHLG